MQTLLAVISSRIRVFRGQYFLVRNMSYIQKRQA